MAGLGWWVQTQWIDRQRRLWREHDAKLAAAWHEESEDDVDNVIVLPDVVVLPEAGASITRR